jgi:tetratricopeptide (TPR) repeat protein
MSGNRGHSIADTTPHSRLEKMALIASGVESRDEIAHYLALLDELEQQIASSTPEGDDVARARALFRWLWRTKSERYQPRGSFRLNEVLTAQIDQGRKGVGNCLGLTVLYNVLAQRLGLQVGAIHLETAFDTGPHVFSLLHTTRNTIDIENIFPHGFDYLGHRDNPGREEWRDRELVADIYLSRGNEFFEAGEWGKAVDNYDRALELNPNYEKVQLNRMMALSQTGGR